MTDVLTETPNPSPVVPGSLCFAEASNPCPVMPGLGHNPVTWIVGGYDPRGPEIRWKSADAHLATQVVAVTPVAGEAGRCHTATVTAQTMGMTLITATQGEQSVSAYVFVGDFFTYQGNEVFHAQSQRWRAWPLLPPGCPSYEDMKGYGVAQVADPEGGSYVVLNFEALHEARGDDLDAVYFFTAEAGGESDRAGSIPSKPTMYAYAPGGVPVWGAGPSAWREPDDIGDIPPHDEMLMRHAALAWAPPVGFPVLAPLKPPVGPTTPPMEPLSPPMEPLAPSLAPLSPPAPPTTPPMEPITPPMEPITPAHALIAAVTCYVLDAGGFPLPAEEGATFYTIQKQPPTR